MHRYFPLLLVLLSFRAFSEPYYYTGEVPGQFSSASAACAADGKDYSTRFKSPLVSATASFKQAGYYNCKIVLESNFRWTVIVRRGDSCPDDKVLNDELGICEPPPKDCSGEKGDILTRGSIAGVVNSNGRNYSLSTPPAKACVDSCTYANNSSPARYSSCYFVKGSTTETFCNYILTGTGESCPGWDWEQPASGDSLNPPDVPDVPPSDPNDPGCPKGWSWSGTTCVKNPTDGSGGGSDNGSGNGSDNGSGGSSGGGTGGNNSGGGSDGSGGSGDGSGDGSGSGSGSDSGGSNTDGGPKERLSKPKPGNFDAANKEWDAKVDTARKLFHDKLESNINSFKGVFDLNLGQGAGALPCDSFRVLDQTISICLTEYSTQFSYLRSVLLLAATVFAALIVLKD